jgi:hypothetical protein
MTSSEICDWPLGNTADEVEVSGDLVVSAAAEYGKKSVSSLQDRVDSWLEEGEDE